MHSSQFKFHYDSINSPQPLLSWVAQILFKFHYDSINSRFLPTYQRSSVKFKFHYDSINSRRFCFLFVRLFFDLNSIMILLIQKKTISDSDYMLTFKFHYDSINSRPKIIPLFKPKNVSILSTSSKFNISFLSLIIYFCNTSYFRRFRLLSIPYIFCTIMGRQKPLIFQVDFVRHILL